MPTPQTPDAVVRAVTAGVSRLVAGGLNEQQRLSEAARIADYYAETTDVRHPFAPLGDTPLRTRRELRDHFANGPTLPAGARFSPTNVVAHRTTEPEVVIVEFAYQGSVAGRAFEMPCIFVVRVRDGLIVESRDYTDHIGSARTFGRLDRLAAALLEDATTHPSTPE